MNTNTVIYETGATTHAVNDLILFTDNTRELAEMRDYIYSKTIADNKQNESITSHLSEDYKAKANKEYLQYKFKDFLHNVTRAYNKELGVTYSYYGLTTKQRNEFARIYANDFENWKQEHNIK